LDNTLQEPAEIEPQDQQDSHDLIEEEGEKLI